MSTPPKRVELTPEQRERLAQLAEHTGKDWRQVLDEAIGAFKPESFFDIASRHGLFGCVKGTPADLSTNPAYMEGFGQDDA